MNNLNSTFKNYTYQGITYNMSTCAKIKSPARFDPKETGVADIVLACELFKKLTDAFTDLNNSNVTLQAAAVQANRTLCNPRAPNATQCPVNLGGPNDISYTFLLCALGGSALFVSVVVIIMHCVHSKREKKIEHHYLDFEPANIRQQQSPSSSCFKIAMEVNVPVDPVSGQILPGLGQKTVKNPMLVNDFSQYALYQQLLNKLLCEHTTKTGF